MNTKDKLIKIGLPCLALIAIPITLILIFCLPKTKTPSLQISANDMTLSIDEEKILSYTLSNPYAVVNFKILDRSIITAEGFKIKAIKSGEAIVLLKAKYQNEIAECQCTIKVLPNENAETNKPKEEENNNDKVEPTVPDDNQSSEPDQELSNELSFEIVNQNGCTVYDNTISVCKDKISFFRISFFEQSQKIDKIISTENIKVTKTDQGFNTWMIVASQSGELSIISNNKTIGTIKIEII